MKPGEKYPKLEAEIIELKEKLAASDYLGRVERHQTYMYGVMAHEEFRKRTEENERRYNKSADNLLAENRKLEAEVIRLQGELIEMSKDVDYWHGAYDTVYDQAMVLKAEVATLTTEQREKVLVEALKAVENERLEEHDRLLAEYDAQSVYEESGEDAAYSTAIRDAENAIKALFAPKVTGDKLSKEAL